MATMPQGLSDFLVRLVNEPELFEEYGKDLEAATEREGLRAEDRSALLTDDLGEIRDRIRTEHPDADVFHVVMEPPPPSPKPPEPEPKPEPEPQPKPN